MSHFDHARLAALMQELLAHLSGRPARLLPFEEVRRSLKLHHLVDRGVREVELEQVVGSLGRAEEFTRAFLPRRESQRDRWQRVERLAEGVGFPPVELYLVDDVYFVVDGHHRVSVLKAQKARTVEAWVKEFLTPVPLKPDDSLADVLLKSGLAAFLEATGLEPREEGELEVTLPSGYERLLEHVAGHRYYLGLETGREPEWREAARSWYEGVYRPMVETVRQSGVVASFPGRTETDLYLFTMDHLHQLRQRYGPGNVGPEAAVEDFTARHRPARRRRRKGQGEKT